MLKDDIHRLRDEGRLPVEIAAELGASIDYVRYVANSYAGGLGAGEPKIRADHHDHLLAISASSDGKGFPYCVAPPRLSTIQSNPVDRPPIGLMSQFDASAKQRIIEP